MTLVTPELLQYKLHYFSSEPNVYLRRGCCSVI